MIETAMLHTRDTCMRLALIQDKCFAHARRAVRIVLAAIPAAVGIYVGLDTTRGMLLLVLAVMFYYFTASMYEQDGERAFRAIPEALRQVSYRFGPQDFTVKTGGEERTVPYSELYALLCDGEYFYLFINPQQAYMMKVSSRDEEAFRSLLSEQTGKKWRSVQAKENLLQSMRSRVRAGQSER